MRRSVRLSHLSGVQVMRHLQHQEEDTQRLLLDGVSLPGLHDLTAQSQERMHLLQLTLHQQQLQTNQRLREDLLTPQTLPHHLTR